MKNLKTIIGVAALIVLATISQAQTNAMPPLPSPGQNATNMINNPKPLQQIIDAGPTIYDQVKSLSLADGFRIIPFGIRHNSDYGGGLALSTANTNGVNAGVGLAAIWEKVKDQVTGKKKTELNFYDAVLNISLNGTTTIPFVNWPVDYFIQSGPAFNLKDVKTVYEQSEAGVTKTWILGKKIALTVGGGEGHCSRWANGFYQEGHAAFVYKPKGW